MWKVRHEVRPLKDNSGLVYPWYVAYIVVVSQNVIQEKAHIGCIDQSSATILARNLNFHGCKPYEAIDPSYNG